MQFHWKAVTKGKNQKVIGLLQDELARKIMTKLVGLRAKTYRHLINDGNENKKVKSTEMCVTKDDLNLRILNTV